MTAPRDPDRMIHAFLSEGQTELADPVFDAVRATIEHRQQRVVVGPWRMPLMSKFVSLGLGAAAVVVALVIGMQFLPSAPGGVGTQPSPSPSPAASPSPSVATSQVRLNVTDGPEALRLVVDVPPAWQRGDPEPEDSHSVVRGDTVPPNGMFIWFGTLANTYADPCGHVLRTPEVGPTVDDLIAAFAETPNMTATEPVQTTLGGRPATYIELTADAELPCPANSFFLAADEHDIYYFIDGPGQVVRIWVLDVDGTRVVAWAMHFPEATAEALAEEQAIIDSVEFEPAN